MEIKKVAVVGAGSGGRMAAVDMAKLGFESALFSRSDEKVAGIREKGGIEVLDIESQPTEFVEGEQL